MHISDINASNRSDYLKNSGVGSTEPVSPTHRGGEQKAESGSDRVEISDGARNASRSPVEVTFARNALQNVPDLSEAKTAQLKERIQSGYYNDSNVLHAIAERLGNELTGRP
jgi:anti-sigma28 factor (negative regulator of flagellin synthesis)